VVVSATLVSQTCHLNSESGRSSAKTINCNQHIHSDRLSAPDFFTHHFLEPKRLLERM
jgi:hypothetical protein